jgi:hypothetical protein
MIIARCACPPRRAMIRAGSQQEGSVEAIVGIVLVVIAILETIIVVRSVTANAR